jgi:DNA replication protein DnaC
LTVIRGKLPLDERAEAIRPTDPGSEPECRICDGTGWRRIKQEGAVRLKQCECVKEKIRTARLSAIPERFKDSTFDSHGPRNPKQARALDLMREDSRSNWYLTGSYGSGKTHLLYAQYREVVLGGKLRFHVRTTRELVEELRRA